MKRLLVFLCMMVMVFGTLEISNATSVFHDTPIAHSTEVFKLWVYFERVGEVDRVTTGNISFDNNGLLWISVNLRTGPSSSSIERHILSIDLQSKNVLNDYSTNSYFDYEGIGFDANNNMVLTDNDDFIVIDPVDGIYFNGNDISTNYMWPMGSVGGGTKEAVGIDFDENGNLLVSRSVGGPGVNQEIFVLENDYTTYSSFIFNPEHPGGSTHNPRDVAVHPNGDIYLGSIGYVEIFDGQTYEHIGEIDPPHQMTGIEIDWDGQLYISETDYVDDIGKVTTTIYLIDGYNDQDPTPDPIPEPSTMLLLGSGLMGLVVFRRKFNKS